MIARRKTGWIGADVGNSTVKVVQVARTSRGYKPVAMVAIPRTDLWPAERGPDNEPGTSVDQLRTARSLGLGFLGRRVAAALPMSVCEFQLLDPPLQPARTRGGPNLAATVETLTQRPANELRYATWPAEPPRRDNPVCENLFAVAADWTDQLCIDVARAGWSCQVIDALPFCLARAVSMVDRRTDPGPIGVIDLGYRRATFCVVLDRTPVYLRTLKGCGQQQLLADLAEQLGVDRCEAETLLAEHGVAAARSPNEAGRLIAEMTAEPLARLESEIRRTIDHLSCQRNSIIPQEIALFGGGATMRGLADELAGRLDQDVYCWRLDGHRRREVEEAAAPSCLFGAAIALSALAWEAA